MRRELNLYFLTLLLTTSTFIVGCSDSKKPLSKIETNDLNVVVVLVDTLRADHLPPYGYKKDTAPYLSSLAEKSIVFDRAFSSCSYTAPAVASVFTSLYPSQHGVITGHFANIRLQKGEQTVTFDRIPSELTTIAEKMKSAGYRTFGIADNLNISEEMGFTQGFDKFVTYRYENATKVNETIKSWAPEIKQGGKYYLYVHYMDPHEPYNQRSPWYQDSDDQKEQMINAYDSEIRFTDEHMKELFQLLEVEKNSIVFFLADHGEEFWEHGQVGHGKSLYNEVIRVPFILYAPGISAAKVSDHVSTMDLLPTLAALVGLEHENVWEGRNLLPLIDNNQKEDRYLLSELLRKEEHPRPEIRSVVTPDWHYITTKPKKKAKKEELYNMRTDFTEKVDQIKNKPDIAKNLANRMELIGKTKVHSVETHVEKPISPEGLEELRTLGYAE